MKIKESNQLVNCFKNKTVLITGNKGFIGTWMSLWLNELNCNVIGITKSKDSFHIFHESIKKNLNIKQLYCDVTNKVKLEKIIIKHTPDYIFDLSGQPLVNKSLLNPYETFKDNILGTINFLEVCRKNNLNTTLITISTENVFKQTKNNIETKFINPYLASKLAKELITSCYNSTYFIKSKSKTKIIFLKPSNIFGGGDFAEGRLVPELIKSKINRKNFILKNPFETRPWIYVHDFCFETLSYISKNKSAEPSDFSNLKFQSNKLLNKKMVSLVEKEYNTLTTSLKIKKDAKKEPSQLSLKIAETIGWYIINEKNSQEIYKTSINQIKNFF